jgi:NAD-dependent protein deacetylase/lipoamidase
VEDAVAMALEKRIVMLANWMLNAKHLVVFTGAGISTESGLADFRGPDGLWTRQAKGLPTKSIDFTSAEPNAGHLAIAELQRLGKLAFLISQNVDNLHLKSGIRPEIIAELHGNITKLCCQSCEFLMDNFGDQMSCPICGGQMASSVVNFGQSLSPHVLEDAHRHSKKADLFLAVGSSLVVTPAANMPKVALQAGARLVIINQGETPLDSAAHLRFEERISDVLPPAVAKLREMMQRG